MVTIYESAYAKLNLTLDVLNKRADGYHNLKSVMQTISLRDEIEIDIDTGKPWMLTCSNEEIPTDSRNLAWKAAEAFLQAVNKDSNGLTIRIVKQIPSGAGLAGGSADAAAVLRALNRHYGYPYSIFELAEIGATVGSDVPFCTIGGTAMVEGRGEFVRKLPDMPDCIFVVCKPEFSISTPELYQKMDASTITKHPDNATMENALISGDLGTIVENLCNIFDPVVSSEHSEVDDIKSIFHTYGVTGYQMTGSGSAVFAILQDSETATTICNALKGKYPNVYIAKPV